MPALGLARVVQHKYKVGGRQREACFEQKETVLMKGVRNLFFLAVVTVPSATACATAAPIPGIFNTGVGVDGQPLRSGAPDPHYRLVKTTGADEVEAFVVEDTGYPLSRVARERASLEVDWPASRPENVGATRRVQVPDRV
jgi:hypothetical protein